MNLFKKCKRDLLSGLDFNKCDNQGFVISCGGCIFANC